MSGCFEFCSEHLFVSGGLHLLARSDRLVMAVCFRGYALLVIILRWVLGVVVCGGGGDDGGGGRGIQTVCWSEKTANAVCESIWSAAVGFWLVSALLYTVYLVRSLQARKFIIR